MEIIKKKKEEEEEGVILCGHKFTTFLTGPTYIM
jgi:hypothetical protein